MTRPGLPADDALRMLWYRYAATQTESVESLLAILRSLEGQSIEEQQAHFEINSVDFARLQSMRMPRSDQFASDAERIAAACHVGKPFALVQALLLARTLAPGHSGLGQDNEEQSYEAAYDASEFVVDPEDAE